MLQSPAFWRMVALAIFIPIMAVILIGARWFFENIPEWLAMFLGGALPFLAIGYLLGLRDGRKQALHPEASPE